MAKTKRLAFMALLTAMALTIFVIEAQIPAPVPIPGVKLGLSNIITLTAMLLLGKKEAGIVLLLRIIMGAMFTGSPAAPVRPERIETALAGRFYALQVRDKTTARQELWERCGEDTLRGLFLRIWRYRCGVDPQSRRLM